MGSEADQACLVEACNRISLACNTTALELGSTGRTRNAVEAGQRDSPWECAKRFGSAAA